MKLLVCLSLLWFVTVRSAGAEWTPAFDLDNCVTRANLVVEGTLDLQGKLTLKRARNYRESVPKDGLLNIDLDQAHRDALRATLGNDGPYEVVVFLGPPQVRPAPLPPLWPLIATYPSLVAFDHDSVYLTPDDTTKGLLVKSPGYTRASFLEALYPPWNYWSFPINSPDGRQKEYDAALVIAMHREQDDLARALLTARADVNAAASERLGMQGAVLASLDPGRPLATIDVYRCGRNKPSPAQFLEFLSLLLSKGADPNLADKYGVTPLMMADRAGSEEAIAMLQKVGAHPFDPKDPKTQAAFVRIDAEVLTEIMNYRDVIMTQTRTPYDFDKIQADLGAPFMQLQTYKVLASKAVDVLGNPYIIYRNADWHDVRINPKTVEALSSAVGADYWEGFVPKPGEWD